jgi:hypothetical protein
MTLDYHKVWKTMNELESVTSKICSAREILDSAIDALENHKLEKTETLLYAVDEFLQYYLSEFDTKFKDAWKETVTKLNQETIKIEDLHRSWDSPGMWGTVGSANTAISSPPDSHSSYYYDHNRNDYYRLSPFDKVVKWRLPIEEVKDSDSDETEYFITFPDDLLEAANLNPGDEVEWVDRDDGNFLLRKVTKPLGMDE